MTTCKVPGAVQRTTKWHVLWGSERKVCKGGGQACRIGQEERPIWNIVKDELEFLVRNTFFLVHPF